ncbi:DNA recombination protein RmuC [Rhodoblastus acidophilus]|uniref:DNA recombination protein RmuC homolog n=1 Tax=Rhodoblastus acidophilus TaxID=1074 RepID=A0A212S1T0_RHOAC|nr:DNA recombination protein RmuC [Rhodoblastus acidophilus]MCW2315954.1 DNA recombination protein RmuC [Rhodoblastus acidophilus]PPQ38183.1 DNA recombination protein RmuC [Rhodoblastus acidophilus]RAI16477.1 DNA recombination protein RmuC [Rhodoblastus acidophilus]SNB78930.1 DNA recombination protein RmuC [Rhodoblastus acidophilus]
MSDPPVFMVSTFPVTPVELAAAAAGVLLFVLLALLARSGRGDRDAQMAALAHSHAEMAGRMQTLAEILGGRQLDFARVVSEKLDRSTHRVNERLELSARATLGNLSALNERLALIDAAQARMTHLTEEIAGFREVLSNKQLRGAFGQGRMEAIIRDALPPNAYAFQYTLSTGVRPDCALKLPGDDKILAVDAKFPLEAFTALKEARDEPARKAAMARARADVLKHVKDISDRYLLPGETQDVALLFVPSESLFAELHEKFEDVILKAHRARVLIVSPSLLLMAVQVLQSLVRDALVRDQAHVIQAETRRLVEDVLRLRTRVEKLDGHFRQANEDIAAILTSTEKIARSGERIDRMEFREVGRLEAAQ